MYYQLKLGALVWLMFFGGASALYYRSSPHPQPSTLASALHYRTPHTQASAFYYR